MDGKNRSALLNIGDEKSVPASGIAKSFYDNSLNGNVVNEIIHSHPNSSRPSGYNRQTGELLSPVRGDARAAVDYPVNRLGVPILRAVYRPAFQSINRYDLMRVYPIEKFMK